MCGLCQVAIQRKLLTCEGLTLKMAYKTAYGMEAAELRAGELQITLLQRLSLESGSTDIIAEERSPGI